MASLANAAAALLPAPDGGSGSKYFPRGSPRATSRTRFDTGLVRFECKDANVMNGGKANMPAHMRQLLAIVQRADESAIILPIDMEGATPVSRIEKAEAIKDADDVSRYLKDVSNGYVRGSKGAKGVRFTMRMRLQKTVKAIKWDNKVELTLKKMGIWMEAHTTKSTDPVKIGFLIEHPNLTNQEAMMQDLRKRGLPHVGDTRMASMGELVKQTVYASKEGIEGQALVLYADASIKDKWDSHMMDLMREGKTEEHAFIEDAAGRHLRKAWVDQMNIGWTNMIKGRISPYWGLAQNECYRDRFPEKKTLSAQVFQIRLIRGMWQLFEGIWFQRNAILHHNDDNANHDACNKKIREFYRNRRHLVDEHDLPLFRMFRKREYRDLPLATKERWLEQVQLAIKSKHGTLDVPSMKPLTDYFPIQNQ